MLSHSIILWFVFSFLIMLSAFPCKHKKQRRVGKYWDFSDGLLEESLKCCRKCYSLEGSAGGPCAALGDPRLCDLALWGCLDTGCSPHPGFGGASVKQDTWLGSPSYSIYCHTGLSLGSVLGFIRLTAALQHVGLWDGAVFSGEHFV